MKKVLKILSLSFLLLIVAPLCMISLYFKFFTFSMWHDDEPSGICYYLPDAVLEPTFSLFTENVIPNIPYEYYLKRFSKNPAAKCIWYDEMDLPPFYTYFTSFGWLIQTLLLGLNIHALCLACKKTRIYDSTEEFSEDDCEIYRCKMPKSRPSDFCFSLFDGSVFVDFAKKGGLLYLLRISFDGYGCYSVPGSSNPLNKEHTKSFLKIVRGGMKDQTELLGLIKTAIRLNRPLLDADEPLQKYKLLDNADFHFILCRDKFDVAAIEKITEQGLHANPELYAGLLECLMDMNWPVAKAALGKMIFDDKKIIPYLNAVLSSRDDEWIYFVKENVLPRLSKKIQNAMKINVKNVILNLFQNLCFCMTKIL